MKINEKIVVLKRNTKNILRKFSKMKKRILFLKHRIITNESQLKRSFFFFFIHFLISSSIFFYLFNFIFFSSSLSFHMFFLLSSHLLFFLIHMRSFVLSFARQLARFRFSRRKS